MDEARRDPEEAEHLDRLLKDRDMDRCGENGRLSCASAEI